MGLGKFPASASHRGGATQATARTNWTRAALRMRIGISGLGAAALKPDLGRLVKTSAPTKPRKGKAPDRAPTAAEAGERRTSTELTGAKAKIEDLQRKLEHAEARASNAEERAAAAEARAATSERRRTSVSPCCALRSASSLRGPLAPALSERGSQAQAATATPLPCNATNPGYEGQRLPLLGRLRLATLRADHDFLDPICLGPY
jgi:hypothetical protein